METSSLIKTKRVLAVMHVLTWIVFIGLMVQSGAVLFSYLFIMIKPESVKNLYPGLEGLNLVELRQSDVAQYTVAMFFKAVVPALKSYIAYVVIKTISKINLQNPFTMFVVRKLESISYDLVAIWAVVVIQHAHIEWLKVETGTDWGGGETLFMAALVFVISQIFKRGVELQSESDLTV